MLAILDHALDELLFSIVRSAMDDTPDGPSAAAAPMEPVAGGDEGPDWSTHLTSMLSFSMATESPAVPEESEEASVRAALDAAAAAEASGFEASATTATENETASVNVAAEGNDAYGSGAPETDTHADGDGGWSASLSSMLPTFAVGDEASDLGTETEDALDSAENEAMDAAMATAEVRHSSRCSASRALVSHADHVSCTLRTQAQDAANADAVAAAAAAKAAEDKPPAVQPVMHVPAPKERRVEDSKRGAHDSSTVGGGLGLFGDDAEGGDQAAAVDHETEEKVLVEELQAVWTSALNDAQEEERNHKYRRNEVKNRRRARDLAEEEAKDAGDAFEAESELSNKTYRASTAKRAEKAEKMKAVAEANAAELARAQHAEHYQDADRRALQITHGDSNLVAPLSVGGHSASFKVPKPGDHHHAHSFSMSLASLSQIRLREDEEGDHRSESVRFEALADSVDTETRDLLATIKNSLPANELFVDPDFTIRCEDSGTSMRHTLTARPHELQWDRDMGKIDPARAASKYTLFDGPPRAEDVKQGALANCWFLSVLSVLAEHNSGVLVKALFPGGQAQRKQANANGAYVVRLCRGGVWQSIVVDDQLPCIGGEHKYIQLAYAGKSGHKLWPAIVEKV